MSDGGAEDAPDCERVPWRRVQSPIDIELNIVDLSFDSLDRQRNTCLTQGCHDRKLINDQVITDTATKQRMSSYQQKSPDPIGFSWIGGVSG